MKIKSGSDSGDSDPTIRPAPHVLCPISTPSRSPPMNIWQTVVDTIRDEFHDLDDAAQWTRAVLRLSVALLLGGILGFEREVERKSAGLRTHMLVALGSALIVVAPQLAGALMADMTRVIQGLVTGIGFLGA